LVILCADIETQKSDDKMTKLVMEADITAVYYGMSVDHSGKMLRYIWLIALRRYLSSVQKHRQCKQLVAATLLDASLICVCMKDDLWPQLVCDTTNGSMNKMYTNRRCKKINVTWYCNAKHLHEYQTILWVWIYTLHIIKWW